MSFWENREVFLRLSEAGNTALAGMFEQTDFVQVYVQWADEHGLWVVLSRTGDSEATMMLVKWHHFETAQVDVDLSPQASSRPIGFAK